MGNTNKRIEIDAVIKTTLQGFDSTIKDLQSKLKSGALSMDLTKGIGKDLSKLFANFETGFSRLKQLTPDGFLNIGDSQEFQKEGKNIIKTIQEISRIAGDLGTKNLLDAKKLFPSAFDSRTSDLLSRINQIDAAFQTLGRKQNAFNNLEVEIKGISARLQEVENLAANKNELSKTFQEASQAAKDTTEKVQQLREQMSAQIQLKISSESFDKVQTEVKELEGQLSALTQKGVTTGKGGKGVYQGKGVGDWEKALKSGTEEEKAQASAALELLRNYNKINQALKEQQKLLADAKKLQEISSQPGGLEDSKNLKDASKILGNKEQVALALDAQAQAAERAAIAQNNLNVAENANTEKAGLQEKLAKKTQQLAELKTTIDGLKGATDLGALTKSVNELTNSNFQPVKEDLESMAEAVRKVDTTAYEQLKQKLSELGIVLPGVSQDLGGLREGFDQAGDKVETFNRQLSEVESLKQRIAYFFGLSNSIQLFKRAVTSAMNTVKELDATMTEAAVVTEFSIGDMWEKLPEYSKNAQDLGVSINGMYQATTLYYQQGLKTNEAMQLGVETMKMARIASMNSTEATKAMTAALRGFNMELNETSATKVNDVYSQLAAVTAADTNQIATAMEKTASIAASANMEFETTAALLAQIIETTQEAPETAGTAMKTIIARFAEVKSLRDQGLVNGEDEEGELIDVNKIQTALHTVGISMEGFFAGTEGLDSILLKLSQKWDTLDFETQRYIATMAAGSRQQSRFIAMMSDYGRTTELVSEAQNSAGASQKQFEKTQDSLTTSLTRLDNAWDEFLMGLANDEALKFGVDVLTKLLETINKVTDAISGGNGLAKSVVSLIGVMGALTAGKGLLNGTVIGGKVGGLAGKFGLSKDGKQPGAIKAYSKAIREKGFFAANQKMVSETVINKDGLINRINSSVGWQKNTGAADGMKKLVEQLDQGEISADKAAKKFKELGGDIEGLSETGQVAALDLDGLSRSLSATGTALIGAGIATSLLASAFESWGLEEQAAKIQKLSGVLMGAGTALSAISSILPVLTGLTWEQAAATLAAYWPIAAIAAALGAIILLWVILAKRAKEASLEGRMEAAAEATERAKKEAEAANEAYNELLSAKEGYDELQTQLDELTKGTLEWKKALADSNAEVLKLLETYPELAQYLTRGEHGELEIGEAGWSYMEEYSSQALANAQTAVINSQIEETRLKISKLSEDFSEETASLGGYNWIAIRNAYEEGGVQGAKDEIANRGIAGEGEEEAWRLIEAYEELKKAINSEKLALQAQTEALLQSQVAQETFEYEFGRELISGMATGYSKRQQFFEMEKADELLETNDEESLRELYAKITGQSIEQIKETFGNDMQELAKEIAKILGPQEWAKEMDQVAQVMSKLDASTQRAYSVMLSGDISGATQDFQNVADTDFEEVARSLGLVTDDGKGDAEKLKELFGLTGENFDVIGELVAGAFEEIRAKAANYGIKTYEKAFASATVKQLGAYTDMMLYSTTSGGTDSLQGGFDKILDRMTGTQKQQALSMMSTYDFTKEGAGESFVQDLRNIGVVLDESDSVIQKFIEQMDMVNAIFRDFDLSDVYDEVKKGLEEAEEVAEAEYLSFEQYEKYAKEGMIDTADWTWNGKGWVNIENGMAELVQALKDNTLSNYNLTKQEAEEQKKWYKDKAKDFGNLQGTYYYDEQGGIYSAPKGVKKAKAVEDLGAYLAQEGLAETVWSRFFATAEEYKRWGELFNGGFANLETFLAGTETFDPTKVVLDAEKAWENPYDKFYNTIEKINAELRKREKLERTYQRLIKNEDATAQDLIKNSEQQLESLAKQRGLQQYLKTNKEQQAKDLMSSSGLGAYAQFNAKDGTIQIDWQAIENITDEKKGQEIEDYISKLEEIRDQYQDAEDALEDIEDQVEEVLNQGKQEYLDLENQIKDAIVSARQEEIDKLTAINDTIASTNDKILNSMRESVDYQRQMRDNQKTEEDLAKKQERLAYLKQDSSGANALEILALEEEISQQQEDYTDSLIDQKISELERQNEEAKQQRQQQIDILKEQLDYEVRNGIIWEQVQELWNEGVDVNGLIEGSILEGLLKEGADWESMSRQQKEDWAGDLAADVKSAVAWKNLQESLADGKIATDKVITAESQNIQDHLGEERGKSEQPEETVVETTVTVNEKAGANNNSQVNDKQITSKVTIKRFKTGGLADFTGPAWLDGTKSRPEYILNADQTQAFFKLIDVLGSFNDLGKTAQNSEENTYDIDINVESVGSDYDVERIAEKVKDLVLTSARYRNNNIL